MSDSKSDNDVNKPPSYQVKRITSTGQKSMESMTRRELLDATGLSAGDVILVDLISDSLPMLEVVRTEAILFNFGSLHMIGTPNCLYMLHHTSECEAFEKLLESDFGGSFDIFLLKVIVSAFVTVIDHMKSQVMDLQSDVTRINDILPERLPVRAVMELDCSIDMLIELDSKVKNLHRCLMRILEDSLRLYEILSLGRDAQLSVEQKDYIEVLLESFIQRSSTYHLDIKRLLDISNDVKKTNDLNLSIWRDNITQARLYLTMMTFSVMVAAIFSHVARLYFGW